MGNLFIRKVIVIIFMVVFSIFLISCDPIAFYFKNYPRNDEIESIELISYSPENVAVIESTDDMLDFISENVEILEILDTSKKESFISEFSSIEFFQGYPHLNTPYGMGIRIIYENGDFLIVTDSLIDEDRYGDAILFNSSGEFIEYFGGLSWRPSFIDLVNGYFETQIE